MKSMLAAPPLLGLLATNLFLLLLLLLPSLAGASSLPARTPPPHPTSQQPTVKILVCGDSITQGREPDFTWRYRLWEWFQAAPATTPTLEYVGPYNGTLPRAAPSTSIDPAVPQTWGAYHASVAPAFSPGGGSAHFAVYGRPAWQDVELIGAQVRRYAPEVVVLHLGFNDIGWWGATPEQLLENVGLLVVHARMARADVTVLIADVSHRVWVREDIPVTTEAYNALLRVKVGEWSVPGSPVVMVPVSEDYDCRTDACPAGIDGLHPNALGDFQIARAYTKVLHSHFGYGEGPLVVPPVETIPGMEDFAAADPLSPPIVPLEPIPGAAAPPLALPAVEEAEKQQQVPDQHDAPHEETVDGSALVIPRQSPPIAVFVAVSVVCLAAVVGLRRLRRRGKGVGDFMYLRLPTTVKDEDL